MSRLRESAVAGRFYPGSPASCEQAADELLRAAPRRAAVGSVTPHAGWIYSGPTAALAIAGISATLPETVVIFGAVHIPTSHRASVYPAGAWRTPLGDTGVDGELAAALARERDFVLDAGPHEYEHSIEVQLPLVQRALPGAMILPVMVLPGPWAAGIGRVSAAAAAALGRRVVFLGSSDLTHYGPAFGFEPHGRGSAGITWARDVNDREIIGRIRALDADGVISQAAADHSACGAGALAAVIAAAVAAGARRYEEVQQVTSAEVEGRTGREPVNSVGYEAGLFFRA